MITNPTQRQIDTRHNQDKVIVLNKSIKIKLLEHIMDRLTGNKPSYVMYNGKQYESNELIIYSKEELASMHSEAIKATIGNKANRYKTLSKVNITANINSILLEAPNGTTINMNYNDIYNILQHVQNLYDIAVDNPKQFEYTAIDLYRAQEFNYRLNDTTMEKFTFINNLYLDISIIQNNTTNKYTAIERFLNIELTNEFDTVEEAKKELNDTIATRLHLIMEDKKVSDKIFKYNTIDLSKEKNT